MARARGKKSAEHTEGLARKIWLAGLGAYGMSIEDAQGQLGKASQGATRFFQDLVQKGQAIEDQTRGAIRSRIDGARDRISARAESNTRTVEELIQRVRERMTPAGGVQGQFDALSRQVDVLATALGRIGGATATTRARRKPATREKAKPARAGKATAARSSASRSARRGSGAGKKTVSAGKTPKPAVKRKTSTARRSSG